MGDDKIQQANVGISALGVAIPKYALPLPELAKIHQISPEKYTESLGCQFMSLCAADENVVSLAIKAANRAIDNWGGDPNEIGLLISATESSVDMSRPLSSWIMEALKLSGKLRSYEVKHACYGGTVAVRQAVEWHLSGNSKGKVALVVAADVALYAAGHSGEPTQGAGAVAMIIAEPTIATINPQSYYWSESQYDFWRPVGNKYPEVNGRLSLSSYITAAVQCFSQLTTAESLGNYLQEFKFTAFHVPFPKMVFKAVRKLGTLCGWNEEQTLDFYQQKVLATMVWNQQIGNSYTASLWFAVAQALIQTQPGEQIAAFSYGSGCGSELLTLQCNTNQSNANWVQQLQQDLADRIFINAAQYQELRNNYELTI